MDPGGDAARPAPETAPSLAGVPVVRARTASAPAAPFAGDLALLRSGSFVERSRAAERLVAAGEAALPWLGRAGPAWVPSPGGRQVSSTEPVLASILSRLEDGAVRRTLSSPWATVRRASAAELGQRGRWSAVPVLMERMDDEESGVRAAAAAALRRLTNQFFGFRADASAPARSAAANRWRSWWSVEGRLRRDAEGGRGSG